MQKSAPSPAQLITMVVFALSCFGLLLFLWLSFGGPIPLKPKGYQVQVGFPEATTLAIEADVRIAGVSVGKVRKLDVDNGHNRTLATLELDSAYAPLHKDARAILRQKTLLGETYVELTPGRGKKIPEGGRLADGQVQDTVQLDEIFDALDPQTPESKTALPATREVLAGAEPLLAALHPFLGQVNPILQFLEASQYQVTDFMTYGAAALADTTASPGGGVGHYLRQFGPLGSESAAIYRERLPTNRGQTYVGPGHLFGPESMTFLDAPSSDCANTGGEHPPSQGNPGCYKAKPLRFQGRIQGDFPHIQAENYLRDGK